MRVCVYTCFAHALVVGPAYVCACWCVRVCTCVCLTGGVILPVINVAQSWLPGCWLLCEQTDWAFHVDIPTRSHEWKRVKEVLMLGIVEISLYL